MSDALDKEIEKAVSDIVEDESSPDKAPDFPGLQYLGCGYDIFGRYGSPQAARGLVFDFSNEETTKRQFLDRNLTATQLSGCFATLPPDLKLYYTLPKRVQYKPTFVTKVEYQSSGSLAKEQQEFSANVGLSANVGAFDGEFEARYEQKKSRMVTRKFYSATAIARYYDLTMANFPSAELHPKDLPVAEIFKKDLHDKKVSPEKLFDNYGTHYLSAITVGCRAVYSHSIDTSKLESELSVDAKLKVIYEGVGGHAGAKYISTNEDDTDAEQIKYYSEGLDPAAGDGEEGGEHNVAVPNVRPLLMLKSGWHNPVLIDLPHNALTPIWYLCTNKSRREELEEGFEAYAKKRGHILSELPANIRPLYLLRKEENGAPLYRFSKKLSKTFWQGAEPVGRNPAVYVFDTPQEKTVPLYEYFRDTPNSNDYRYETATWQPYLDWFDKRWKKTSGQPIGYVYDAMNDGEKESVPVYAYVRKDAGKGHWGQFYSTDESDTRDNDGWRAMVLPDDDLWNPNIPLANLPSNVTDVLGLDNNVHWKSPKVPES